MIYLLPLFITQLCAIEDSPHSQLLNASHIHHLPEGLADTANTQPSPSTVNYDMIAVIIAGVNLLVVLVCGSFAKWCWDKLRRTNTSSNSEVEFELGSSISQTA
ncbi:hypothetical protein MKX08_000094 [Trichoderma sp. CBMAI-0020]|nr:hypothetical protein MKX08_000094 [Trichoderma sp. CBMAI-0020]